MSALLSWVSTYPHLWKKRIVTVTNGRYNRGIPDAGDEFILTCIPDSGLVPRRKDEHDRML